MNEKALLLRLEKQIRELGQAATVKDKDIDERVKSLLQKLQTLEVAVEVLKRRP